METNGLGEDSSLKSGRIKKPAYVMHLIATNFYGGPEKQIVEHFKRLNPSQFRGVLVSFREGRTQNELLEVAAKEGLVARGIPMKGPIDLRAQFYLNRIIGDENIDLLVVHGYKSCVMGLWAGKEYGIPILAYSRGYTAENKKIAFYNWIERQCLKRVAGIAVVSAGQEKRLSRFGIAPKNLWVVHNAVSVPINEIKSAAEKRSKILERFNIPANAKIIVTAGRFSPEKGHRSLVDAIPKINSEANDTCFVFCGNGPLNEELRQQAKNLGVINRCRFIGFRRDLLNIFSAMDLMVLPSLSEGLPNVVLEAFAVGKPVVATAVGGVPEVVEHGVSGYLVLPGRPDLLAAAIVKMLSDPEMMQTMGLAGYDRVKKDFTFEAQTEKLEAIYMHVLGSRHMTHGNSLAI